MSSNLASRRRWGRGGATRRAGERRRLRPGVLALEGRRLLTTFIPVTSTLDTGSGTLRAAFARAADTAGPVEIDFRIPTPATIDLTHGQLELSDTKGPVSIVGPGATKLTIDGGGASRVLQIDPGVTATISGLTISGGSTAGNGGGLANAGTATLIGVALTGNRSSAEPPSSGGTVIFDLDPTSADGGGGAYDAPSGRLTLDDCSVTGNSASYLGGGVLSMGDLTIAGSTFQANTAGLDGGGLQQGVSGSSANLAVEGSTFVGNFAAGPGGMECYGTVTLDRSRLEDNNGGGMVLQGATATVTGCTISGNSAVDGGGVLIDGTSRLSLKGSTIEGNSSGNGAGGVSNYGTLTADRCTISGNHGEGFGAGGGGLSNSGGTATLLDSVISDNTVGFGLYGTGGGINDSDGELTLERCTVSDNTAAGAGGGFAITLGKATIRDCDFIGNAAGEYGGGACVGSGSSSPSPGSASMSGCRFAGNSSKQYGGGIAVTAGSLTIANSAVAGNSAASQGGGLFAWETSYGGASHLTMQGVTVDGDTAVDGGGILNDGVLAATGIVLSHNAAATGGGRDNAAGATATVTGSAILDNDASADGGGIANAGTITVRTTLILGNTAAGHGGGLYNSGTAALTDCLISGNVAASGGGIYAAPGGSVTLASTWVAGKQKGNIVGTVTDG